MNNTTTEVNMVSPQAEKAVASKVILPYEKTKEYYIEPLGEIERKPVYEFIKRFFDIVLSMTALIVLALPMAVIAFLIKIKSPGPALYRQERLGLNGKKIKIVKFRTMSVDAEAAGAQWSQGDDDPRIFPLGRKLRKTRLDELPQLASIFTGERDIIETTKKNVGLTRVVAA